MTTAMVYRIAVTKTAEDRARMNVQLIQVYVFVLAGFVGFFVITRVPALLHTPLMSTTNAISAISLVGSLVMAGADHGTPATILGFVAVTLTLGLIAL